MAGIMALSLAACGSGSSSAPAAEEKQDAAGAATEAAAADDAAADAAPAEITTIADGVLTVGTSPDFAPYEFYYIDESGNPQLAGFDVALAQRIADNLGLELKVVPMDFDGILMELQNGNIDLGISGFSPSPERAETFDFSDLYYMGGQSFVIRVADKDKYTDYAAFDGLPVGAQTGSIQMGLAEENTPNANIIGLPKVTDLINELLSGKLEGAFIETAVAEQYIKNYPDLMIAWEVPYDTEGSAIALKKGNDGLREAVNGVIKEVLADGSMDEYIATAQDQASDEGSVYEGMLDENGEVQESVDEAATEAAAE
ncbi:MAG: transporter substrate-binding domain-containing protein [Lachnospiraceae bacterium]|nr:transporter substrate-binding domain-containing protein [Lachnospiraceae bacterium]